MITILRKINVEFLRRLVSVPGRDVPGIGPEPPSITVEITETRGRYANAYGWRLLWSEQNAPLRGHVSIDDAMYSETYGGMEDSTNEERIARAEYAAYTFLLDNGWRPKKWEHI